MRKYFQQPRRQKFYQNIFCEIYFCLIAIAIAAAPCRAENHWHQQNPGGFGFGVQPTSVEMFDSTHCVIVANKSSMRTTDAGRSWQQSFDTLRTPTCVQYFTVNTIIAIDSGIRRSTNAGATWTEILPAENFFTAQSIDSNNAVALGATGDSSALLYTTDRGLTWRPRSTPIMMKLIDICFVSNDHGFAMSRDTLLHTTNGGLQWMRIALDTSHVPTAFAFYNDGMGIFTDSSSDSIFWTSDGGAHWLPRAQPTIGRFKIARFIDSATIVLMGGDAVTRSTDQGITWIDPFYFEANPELYLYGISHAAGRSLVIVGSDVWWYGAVVFRSDDAGATLNVQSYQSPNLSDVAFVNDSTLIAVGDLGTILRTTDTGAHWTRLNNNVLNEFTGVKFSSATNGAIVGDGGVAFFTTDGGAQWNKSSSAPVNQMISLAFVDSLHGLAVGWYGEISGTTDGGRHWTSDTFDSIVAFTNVAYADSHIAIVLGYWMESLVIGRSTDGGATWTMQHRPEQFGGGLALAFANRSTGVIASPGFFPRTNENIPNLYLRTTNAGADWYDASVGGLIAPGDFICFADSLNGFGTQGMFGGLARTTNGGITWVGTGDGPGRNTAAMAFRGIASGTAVGEYGGIWHVSDSGGALIRNFSVAPRHIDFGAVALGAELQDSVLITNADVDTLQVSGDADYIPGDATVPPGSAVYLHSAFFAANDTGIHNGALHLWGNADLFADSVSWTYRGVGISSVEKHSADIAQFTLNPIYPNPLQSSNAISFSLPREEHAQLCITTITGDVVATLVDANISAGVHTLAWQPKNLPAGAYVCRLQTASGMASRMMLLAR